MVRDAYTGHLKSIEGEFERGGFSLEKSRALSLQMLAGHYVFAENYQIFCLPALANGSMRGGPFSAAASARGGGAGSITGTWRLLSAVLGPRQGDGVGIVA